MKIGIPESPTPARAGRRTESTTSATSNPWSSCDYIEVIENCVGKKAEKNLLPLQPGDVPDTWADTEDLVADVGLPAEYANRELA